MFLIIFDNMSDEKIDITPFLSDEVLSELVPEVSGFDLYRHRGSSDSQEINIEVLVEDKSLDVLGSVTATRKSYQAETRDTPEDWEDQYDVHIIDARLVDEHGHTMYVLMDTERQEVKQAIEKLYNR